MYSRIYLWLRTKCCPFSLCPGVSVKEFFYQSGWQLKNEFSSGLSLSWAIKLSLRFRYFLNNYLLIKFRNRFKLFSICEQGFRFLNLFQKKKKMY